MTDDNIFVEPAPKPKRQVSYNQEAVLCPSCKKRIRLNNSGRLRVHVVGKAGSAECKGSAAKAMTAVIVPDTDIKALADEAEVGYDPTKLFSDSS